MTVTAATRESALTKAERKLVDELNERPAREILEELKDCLQTAAEIELATIPIYLYTYYSIKRTERTGQQMRRIDLFADKAGGVIMSVAVEEMLHLSLACNMLFALGEQPQLYGRSPGTYPTPLPYHNPIGPKGPRGRRQVLIPLAKFGFDQLWHFLQIEYPEKPGALPEHRNWDTIGQFYSYIRCLIHTRHVKDRHFRKGKTQFQIQPYNYSPDNIDTAHPRRRFDPWSAPDEESKPPSAAHVTRFSNASDSGGLFVIESKDDALAAIEEISDQGEGWVHRHETEGWDDPSRHEESHYYKFLSLQAQLEGYDDTDEQVAETPKPPKPAKKPITPEQLAEVVVPFPDNPTSVGYLNVYNESGKVNYRPLSDFCNGVYQYMLIMTESIFKVRDAGENASGDDHPILQNQKLYFNLAMHRSMIWLLDKLVQAMRGYELGDGHVLAPTFENIDLGPRQEAYANVSALADAMAGEPYSSDVEWLVDIFRTLPDVSPLWGKKVEKEPPGPGEPVPPYPYDGVPAFPAEIGPQPPGLPRHACMGLNSCRGSDRFGLTGHEVPGEPGVFEVNSCAGQGYCSTTPDHQCHVQNSCRDQGGCGLYGTAEELNCPGDNACRGLGSCATPINAERFSTNGPNQGKSVWLRARAVFEERYERDLAELREKAPYAPDEPGPAPEPFAATGPPYLWASHDNNERGNMTACGASGLSGAGGCA